MPMNDKKFKHKKSLGQYFLKSEVALEHLAAAADLAPGELVVEVGPGTGALTKTLLSRGARVLALETDQRAITVLKDNCAGGLSGRATHYYPHRCERA